MNDKLCVFAAYPYTDIDALACCIAYAELNDCIAYIPGPLNATVPDCVRNLNLQYTTEFPETAEQFIMVDFSNPEFIPPQIDIDKITKVYDHHTGFEEYWGARGQIEFIGACATIIYELFGDRVPSQTTAKLLATAIFANTLYFNSDITNKRDISAYEKLKNYATLSNNWVEQYYAEVENFMLMDIKTAIKNDLKIMNGDLAVAQLELWDAKVLLRSNEFMKEMGEVLSGYDNWLMTMPSISEKKNYLITNDDELKKELSKKFDAKWDENIGQTPSIYLRKEFRKAFNWK